MVSTDFHDSLLTPGMVTDADPPPILSGMVNVWLDPRGKLTFFQAIPPQSEESATPPKAVDWSVLFGEAGLDPAQFKATEPTWTSLAASDTRVAWTGTWPGTGRPLRVEAAAFQGRPVFFSLIGPWTRPERQRPDEPTAGQRAGNLLLLGLLLSVVTAAGLLARRNYIRGRGDRRGAFRLAGAVFVTLMGLWLCRGHIVPTLSLILPFVLAISTAVFFSGLIWVLYLSIEPYVRRHWPRALVSWSRVLMGQLRDPLVGRDVLFGVILGVIWILIYQVRTGLIIRMGGSPALYSTDYLMGGRAALGAWLINVPGAIQGTLLFFFLLFVLRVILRKEWLAAIAFVAIWVALKTLGSDYPWIEAPAFALLYGTAAIVVVRFGFVALAAGIFATDLLLNVPLTFDFSAWYLTSSLLPLFSVAALAVWGFYTSLGGRKLWEADLFG
jgi:serine/threonine-protein kinase